MQVIHQNEAEEGVSRRTSAIGVVIYVGESSRCVEGKCNKRVGSKGIRIRVSRRIFDELKEEIWQRRRGVSESSRVEEVRTVREDNGRIHTGVQESSKRKQI